MPDPAKFKALREAGYRIPPACGRCVHFVPGGANPKWGRCTAIRYDHAKHGNRRMASVHVLGTCESGFKQDLRKLERFGAHAEFLEEA